MHRTLNDSNKTLVLGGTNFVYHGLSRLHVQLYTVAPKRVSHYQVMKKSY